MYRKNRIILNILRILYSIARAIGMFPLRFNKRTQVFKYSIFGRCIGLLFPLLSLTFPLSCLGFYIMLRSQLMVGLDYLAQNGIYTLHMTGSTVLLFCIHWKNSKKISECSTLLLESFRTIKSKYKRNHFEFDGLLLIVLVAKATVIRMRVMELMLDPFGVGGLPIKVNRFIVLMSSLVNFYLILAYLFIGAMFDNIVSGLEKGYERICIDKQIEGREIYLDETFALYLQIRKCYEILHNCVNPLWFLSVFYLMATISFNLWQLYFGMSTDGEETIIAVELASFSIMIFAASLVPIKAKRVERFLGVFCLEGLNSQREDLEWIDFSKNLLPEFQVTILHFVRLHPLYSILSCVMSANLLDLFLSHSDLFEK